MIPTPFTNMAISLSGGGYRATTFHLGALAYLNSRSYEGKTLLENVKIISTISGGTLTGVMYALYLAEGRSFEDAYHKLYELLKKDELVDRAMHKLNYPKKWKNKHKTRDVINAFSEVYNEEFFEEATFKNLHDGQKSHLKDIIFGSSEFTYGIQFRFQEEHDNGKFGNYYLNLPEDVASEIRLADAAAASSCFPGGFEPIVMPIDFGNGPDSLVEKTWYSKSYQDENYPTTAIMDGGIIDNQGIEGVRLAEKRHEKELGHAYIGTYVASDVSSKMMEPYKVPKFKYSNFKNFFTLNGINIFAGIVAIIIIALWFFGNLPTWGYILTASIFPFTLIWLFLFISFKGVLQSVLKNQVGQSQVPELMKDFRVLYKTPLYILIYLIKFRATSVVQMVSDIFMRRIRSLQLNALYTSSNWNYRFKSNYIYALENNTELPEKMQKIVKAANDMPTTLWFSDEEKEEEVMEDLIACGQFSLCYNLIKYAKRLQTGHNEKRVWNQLTEDQRQSILSLQAAMELDWKKYLHDPYWLNKQLKPSMT